MFVDPRELGAVGTDGAADDRQAIIAAIAKCRATGADLKFPRGGIFRVSRHIDIDELHGLRVVGHGATIRYPSDDLGVMRDDTATAIANARSAFQPRGCRDLTFEGLTFEGGVSPDLQRQQGSGIYAIHCTGLTLERCHAVNGGSLFVQDANSGDRGTRIIGGRSIGVRASMRGGHDFLVDGHAFEHPATADRIDGETWIAGGEKAGIGVALLAAGATVTLASAARSFSASDVGKSIRICAGPANRGVFTILEVIDESTLIYANSRGATEPFRGTWSIDGYDRVGATGSAFGASHFLYIPAGRDGVTISRCTFRNSRMDACKFSGTIAPIRNVKVLDSSFYECAAGVTFGADDVQEHVGLEMSGNYLEDCATGRAGWSSGAAVNVLGSNGASIHDNHFHHTRNTIGSVDGRGVGGVGAITASRYTPTSQPCENFTAHDNRFTRAPGVTRTYDAGAIQIKRARAPRVYRNHFDCAAPVSIQFSTGCTDIVEHGNTHPGGGSVRISP